MHFNIIVFRSFDISVVNLDKLLRFFILVRWSLNIHHSAANKRMLDITIKRLNQFIDVLLYKSFLTVFAIWQLFLNWHLCIWV
jgi:hypothetical protein